jgi:hypothetical protein
LKVGIAGADIECVYCTVRVVEIFSVGLCCAFNETEGIVKSFVSTIISHLHVVVQFVLSSEQW